jgi:hypothetical protein
VYYNCVKFHKKSISSLVGVELTRYNMVAVQHLKGEMIQLIFSRKGRVYLVSGTPTKLLIEFI